MATTYDKASLVMIPSGYKDDKLYSVKPTDGSGDFTFSRDGAGASPATRVNASGYIEKGRENILTYSNDFSNAAWVKVLSSVTGGQSGYDGTNDAYELTKTFTNGSIDQSISTSGVLRFSVYAKAGTLNYMRLRFTGSANLSCFFDFTDGSTHNNDGFDASMEDVGGGWYRCSFAGNFTSVNSVQIYPADSTSSIAGTSGNIYIQDAQLEQGLVATDYIKTTTAPVSAGLLGDMPRLDYSGGATCPSLLLEPSRVNSVPHSEYLAGLDTYNITISSNADTSPEGVVNATQIIETATLSGFYEISKTIGTSVSGQSYTSSVYVKRGVGTRNIALGLSAGAFANGRYAIFNIANQEVVLEDGTARGAIESVGNDWYRISVTGVASASVAYGAGINMCNGTLFTYDGDGSSSFFLYGFQHEQNASYPTSYIPTYGSASTRGADEATRSGITSLIGQTEGTLFIECEAPNFNPNPNANILSTALSIANAIALIYKNNKKFLFSVFHSSVRDDVESSSTFEIGDRVKIAMTYSASGMKLFINGQAQGTNTDAISFNGALSELRVIDQVSVYYGFPHKSTADQVLAFKSALTDAECIALTTI